MTVVFAARAILDMEELHAFIARRSPTQAHTVLARIRVASNPLALFPHSGRAGHLAGTREILVPRSPYRIVYDVREQRVVSLRVVHTSQQWPPRGDGTEMEDG